MAKLIVRTSFLGNQRKISKWSIWQNFSSISDCMTGQYEGFGICKNAQYLHGNIKWVSSHFWIFVWSAWAEGCRGNLFVTIKCRLLQASIINFFMKPFRMVVRKSWSLQVHFKISFIILLRGTLVNSSLTSIQTYLWKAETL